MPDDRPTADIATVATAPIVEDESAPEDQTEAGLETRYLDFVLDKEISQGFGFSMKFDDPSPCVKNVKDSSPAKVAGLMENDEIFAINEKLVENVSSTEVLKMVGEDSFQLRLRVKRTLIPLPTVLPPPPPLPTLPTESTALIEIEDAAEDSSDSGSEDGTFDIVLQKLPGEQSYGFSMHFGGKNPVVKKVNQGTAAERAALIVNDVILAVSGIKIYDLGQNQVFNLIKEAEVELGLTIRRENIFLSSSSEDDLENQAVIVDAEEYCDVFIQKETVEAYGFGLDFTQEMPKVKTLKENSPSDKCGLELHDEIYSVNGILVSSISEDKVIDLLLQSPERLNLRVRRVNAPIGSVNIIILAPYII